MKYEVEMKYPVAEHSELLAQLSARGVVFDKLISEIDYYFAHPCRDFRQTDEALRIRVKDGNLFITYKGPKIDKTSKTRREIDLPLRDGERTLSDWMELLEALGFHCVGEVRKSRQKTRLHWGEKNIEISLDNVENLGVFVELELIVEPDELEVARETIMSLATQLGLQNSERRSYLELLMEKKK